MADFQSGREMLIHKKMVAEYSSASADVQQKIENAFQAMSNIGDVVSLAGM